MIVSQGSLRMQPKLLILGGTSEATSLAEIIVKHKIKATLSYAGRVARIAEQALPKRVGGFGGVEGLKTYLQTHEITHVIDATHPFAAQMSWHAYDACHTLQVPLLSLTRPKWQALANDKWQHVANMDEAAEALSGTARRVMLAIGRMHLARFYAHQQHFYLLRLVDAPTNPPEFADYEAEISRGPFTVEDDIVLLQKHRIDVIVAKNAGGAGASAKIEAARALGIEVIMIDRPALPETDSCHGPEEVLGWLSQNGAEF